MNDEISEAEEHKYPDWVFYLGIALVAYIAIGISYASSDDGSNPVGGDVVWTLLRVAGWPAMWLMGV